MRYCVILVAVTALVTAGCRTSSLPTSGVSGGADCQTIASRLDRGDWMVNQRTRLWKVKVGQSLQAMPPKLVGYLVGKRYRQLRGGPEFQMYTVTSLNRNEQLGHIDSVGRAVRYEPRRNRGFEEVPVGTGTLENSVAAILDTYERVTLEPTTQRQLAFEALDLNRDGLLQPEETTRYGDRIAGADANGDGAVDFQEFSAIETL